MGLEDCRCAASKILRRVDRSSTVNDAQSIMEVHMRKKHVPNPGGNPFQLLIPGAVLVPIPIPPHRRPLVRPGCICGHNHGWPYWCPGMGSTWPYRGYEGSYGPANQGPGTVGGIAGSYHIVCREDRFRRFWDAYHSCTQVIRRFFQDPFGFKGYKKVLREISNTIVASCDRHADATDSLAINIEKLAAAQKAQIMGNIRNANLSYLIPQQVTPEQEQQSEEELYRRLKGL